MWREKGLLRPWFVCGGWMELFYLDGGLLIFCLRGPGGREKTKTDRQFVVVTINRSYPILTRLFFCLCLTSKPKKRKGK